MEIHSQKLIRFCEKISKASIYVSVFLIPIFFLPWTIDSLDFNKQILLGILVTISLIFWGASILISGRFKLNFNFLNIPILIFFLVYGFSTIFSSFRYGSFLGLPSNTSQGFLTLFYFLIFYFLISNIFSKKEETFWLFFLFITSGFLATIFSILQIFGKFIFPWDFTRISSFNTIGSINTISVLLAILLPLIISLIFLTKWLIRWLLIIFSFFFLIFLILVNFRFAWLILTAGTSIVFIFNLLNLKRIGKTNLVFLSMIFLIIALFFLAFPISLPKVQIPIEVLLNQRTGLQIAQNSLRDFKNLFLGTGPSTFAFNYSKFKPIEISQTAFWNLRFNAGASEILDKLTTTGILGILSLFFIFLSFFYFGFKHLVPLSEDKPNSEISLVLGKNWLFSLGIFSSFFGLFFSQFLSSANLSLFFLFWLILGTLAALSSKTKIWTLELSSQVLFSSFISVLIFLILISLSFLLIRNYLAETKYLSGLISWQKGETEIAIDNLSRAINLNSNLDTYFRDISQLYLIRLNETSQQRNLSSEELTKQSQDLMNNALISAKRAIEISKENVSNWNILGFICRNLIGLVGGAEDLALDSYKKAIELEPTNPYTFTEIGRIYLSKANLLKQQKKEEKEINETLTKAKENFQEAIELKSDYSPAHFQIAMIYIAEERIKEAIQKLEEIKLLSPLDSGLAFQLGLLYYNDNQFILAKKEFERAVQIDENYSNARYFLGLIYDREGKEDLAIEQFEKIEKLNPDNLEVKKILENLRTGKKALEGILSSKPLIEEEIPEGKP